MSAVETKLIDLQQQINELRVGIERTHTNDYSPALGELYGQFLGLPALRGFWPMSSYDQNSNPYDLSGQGRTLTVVGGAGLSTNALNNLVPYMDLDGTQAYFYRADEPGTSITGALTLGGWFYPDVVTGTHILISKDDTGAQRSYTLYDNASALYLTIFGASGSENSNGLALTAGTWQFCVARFYPASTLDVFVNGAWSTNVVPANTAIYDRTSQFEIGHDAAGRFFDGRTCLCFLCGAAFGNNLVNYLWQRSRPFFGV
jgi:hypothetical protein